MVRKCVGRKRVILQKVEDPAKRQATFTKRRGGLFKKSSELCTLVSAEVAVLAFSPGGKVFSFGHPSVDTIIDRYLGEGPDEIDEAEQFYQGHRSYWQLSLNKSVTELEGLIAEEEKLSREINQMMKHMFAQRHRWWEKNYKEFTYEECKAFESSLHRLKDFLMQLGQVNQQDAPASNQLNHAEAHFTRGNGVPLDIEVPWLNGQATNSEEPALSGQANDNRDLKGKAPLLIEPQITGSSYGLPFEASRHWFSDHSLNDPYVPVGYSHWMASYSQAPLNQRTQHEVVKIGATSLESIDTETPMVFDMRNLHNSLLAESSMYYWIQRDETFVPVGRGATLDGEPSIDFGPLGPGGSLDNVANLEAGASFDATLSLSNFAVDLSWLYNDDHSSPNI